MASPTQMVVGKGKPNPLIAEGLLKILRDLILFLFLQNSQPIPFHGMVDPQSKQVMLKLSPLTFPRVMVACLQSHPPLFDRSKPDFTTRSFKYSDKLIK